MFKIANILMVSFLFFTEHVNGQLLISNGPQQRAIIKNGLTLNEKSVKKELNKNRGEIICKFGPTRKIDMKEEIIRALPQLVKSSIVKDLGFFCKNELALDKISPISIRFRLGSLDYVNWMEQKPNALKPK